MGNNVVERPKTRKKSFLGTYQGKDVQLVITFNGVRVPIDLEQVTVDWNPENPEFVKQLDFHIKGETDHQLDIGELGRLYEDDPVIQKLLSYVVRAELLYVLEKSWLEQNRRSDPAEPTEEDDQPAAKER